MRGMRKKGWEGGKGVSKAGEGKGKTGRGLVVIGGDWRP